MINFIMGILRWYLGGCHKIVITQVKIDRIIRDLKLSESIKLSEKNLNDIELILKRHINEKPNFDNLKKEVEQIL